MEKLNSPANKVDPDQVKVNEVDDDGTPLLFEQIEGENENHPQQRSNQKQNCLEFVLRSY